MEVVVTGKNVDVPHAVRDATIAKLSKVRRQFDRFIDMEVVFSEDRNPRISSPIRCEVVAHVKGTVIRAEARATDFLAAVDAVEHKLRHQVDRVKGKRLARLQGKLGLRRRGARAAVATPSRDGQEPDEDA